jgi:hypothetical protein
MGMFSDIDYSLIVLQLEKAMANGVATLDSNTKVPKAQISLTASDVGAIASTGNEVLTSLNAASGTISSGLLPSYVDDVLSYTNLAGFPGTGETGKIYVAEDSNKVYRWSGSVYVEISSSATAGEALKLTTPRTIATTGDASYSVSFDGSANVTSAITLATVNSNAGSFGSASSIPAITVNAKGQVTAVSTNSIGNELIAIQSLSDTPGFLKKTGNGTYSIDVSNYLTTNQSITVSGDVTGSGTTSISLTLANSGVTAGTYNASATQVLPFTVDAKGRITATGAAVSITPPWSAITGKPTTLTGYGITDGQPLGNELTALQSLSDTPGFLKKTGDGTYSIDVGSYLSLAGGTLTGGLTLENTTAYYSRVAQSGNNLDIVANGDQAFRVSVGTNNGTGNIRFFTANYALGNTERMQITATGNVGIGLVNPSTKLQVAGTTTTTDMIVSAATPSTSPTTGASRVTGGQGVQGNQYVGGFSSLGGDANHPGIKVKVLTGTTAATEGGATLIAHGVSNIKILTIDVVIDGISHSGFTAVNGYQFNVSYNATNIIVYNHATNSENILSASFLATVIYRE